MSHRTVTLSSFEEYLSSEGYSPDVRADEERERNERLSRFPYTVTLQVSFPELDYANRWCWQRFGPSDGDCLQRQSDYPACSVPEPHSHTGKWMWCFLIKTDYDFGFCEWYFSEQSDRDCFLASVGEINWGEKYA
jgi:hypothetical protein